MTMRKETYNDVKTDSILERKEKMNTKKRIICWGTEKAAQDILQYPLLDNIEILFVCTNDFKQWGNFIYDYEICSPLKIFEVVYDEILVLCGAPRSNFEVIEQLLSMGVEKKQIVSVGDFHLVEYCPNDMDNYFKIKKIDVPQKYEKKPVDIDERYQGETFKAHIRRTREGFFEKYCVGEGLDIGYGLDPITADCFGWDISDGDAQYLASIPDESFDYVYSSHCLEHMRDVREALFNWFRVVKPGGFLILYIPERDLYEKRKELPSRFNADHKHMFLLGKSEEPDTLDILEEISNSIKGYSIEYAKVCDEGHTLYFPNVKSDGEYSIEIVLKKSKL